MESKEITNVVRRSQLFMDIYNIVKQIPRESVECDAMDHPSAAYEIEQYIKKHFLDARKSPSI